jgi:hypothetical protein
MKKSVFMSVAVASALTVSSAFAYTFNYQASGGVDYGEVVDHDLSGPEYDDTCGGPDTLEYRDNFSYNIPPDWTFTKLGAVPATQHSGLSWGFGSIISGPALEPFPQESAARVDCVPSAQSGMGLKSVLTKADASQDGNQTEKPTVDANGQEEVFGMLVHFNRDIWPANAPEGISSPKGLDMNMTWTLFLDDGGSWEHNITSRYHLAFWETSNSATYEEGGSTIGICPRSGASDINQSGTRHVIWRDGTSSDFYADGVFEELKSNGGVGCSDAYDYEPLSSDPLTFNYDGREFTVNVSPGFYKYSYDEASGKYVCDSGEPFDTLWALENNETIACVRFSITYEEGDQGCTPGYWKQSQHLDDWSDYNGYTPLAPTDSYNDIFGVDASSYCSSVDERNAMRKLGGPSVKLCNDDMSLGEALWMRGNADGLGQVIFQSTAALLNAANGDINYPLSAGEIISMVQDAFDNPEHANAVASELDGYNNLHNNDVCGYETDGEITPSSVLY